MLVRKFLFKKFFYRTQVVRFSAEQIDFYRAERTEILLLSMVCAGIGKEFFKVN